MRLFFIIFGLVLHNITGFSQVDTLSSVAISFDEPNYAYIAHEHQGNLIIGGKYFDSEIGSWTSFIVEYSDVNELLNLSTDQINSNIGIQTTNNFVLTAEGIKCLSFGDESDLVLQYSYLSKSLELTDQINRAENDMISYEIALAPDNNSILLCGATLATSLRNGKIILLNGETLMSYEEGDNLSDTYISHVRKNKTNQIVALCQNNEDQLRSVYIILLDENLNLLSTTKGTSSQLSFQSGRGFIIDSENNIVCTGVEIQNNNDGSSTVHPIILKYDSFGNLIWKYLFDYSFNNNNSFGGWNGIVESQNNDGYLLVGANNYYSTNQDSLLAEPTVIKISKQGDIIWRKDFTFRDSGQRIIETFEDIVCTSDGSYLVVGGSMNFDQEINNLPWSQSIFIKISEHGEIDTTSQTIVAYNEKQEIISYPNPASNRLYIKQDFDNEINIEIYDAIGNQLHKYSSIKQDQIVVLNTSMFSSGTYYIIFTNDNGKVQSSKFFVE